MKGQNVKIHLKTHLKDGMLIQEQPDLWFTLGDGDVIQVQINSFSHSLIRQYSFFIIHRHFIVAYWVIHHATVCTST